MLLDDLPRKIEILKFDFDYTITFIEIFFMPHTIHATLSIGCDFAYWCVNRRTFP